MGYRLGVSYPSWFPFAESHHSFQGVTVEGSQRFVGDITQVRKDGDVIHATERMISGWRLEIENINARSRETSRAQRRNQIFLDHNRSARSVDEICRWLHETELAGGNETASPVAELHVDRQDVS